MVHRGLMSEEFPEEEAEKRLEQLEAVVCSMPQKTSLDLLEMAVDYAEKSGFNVDYSYYRGRIEQLRKTIKTGAEGIKTGAGAVSSRP